MAVLLTATVAGALALVTAPMANAASIDAPCASVEAVFARGSGQGLDNNEARRFNEQLQRRIASPSVTLHYYELGSDAPTGYGGQNYKAVDVNNPWNGNGLGAKFSSGFANDYGRSVDSGVGELYNYLLQRQRKCGTARFVLGGYSQGAQVIGQTLQKLASELPGSTDRIDFAALFGDPKLHLPEGEGIFAPACRGEQFSAWRRVVPDCNTDNGSLGARKPYLPAGLTDRTGLWCYDKDFVCGSDPRFTVTEGHFKYADAGNAVDEAALEAARRLARTLPPEQGGQLNTRVEVIGTGTTGLDVVFVIDTTGSMGDDIEQAKLFARNAAGKIGELRGRVALVGYRDQGDAYTAKVFSGLQGDLTEFQAQLDTMAADGGGDTPEAMLHGLMTSLNSLDWRPGATKAAVVLTDADFHDPDLVNGETTTQVAERALEIDPVNVYPIVPDFLVDRYRELAERTTGQVIVNGGDTAASLNTALTKIRNRPVPLLPLTDYYSQPGQQMTFDASKSYVVDSSIVSYEWDFDGDGVFEEKTSQPVISHAYGATFDGVMQVRVTAADGGVANASAFVHVGIAPPEATKPKAPSGLAVEVLSTVAGRSTVRLRWTPADGTAARWGVSVNGVPVGAAAGGVTSVEITDIDQTADVTLGVAGITADDVIGETATTVLAKNSSPTPTTPTCTITGTDRNDVLRGTPGRDVICGLGGSDVISGLGGDDVLLGGPGDDVIRGGPGNDTIDGGAGRNALSGEAGNDSVVGGPGDDVVSGEDGDDRLDGGAGGRNVLDGGVGKDNCTNATVKRGCESG